MSYNEPSSSDDYSKYNAAGEYPYAPTPSYNPPPTSYQVVGGAGTEDTDKTLGVVALVLSLINLVGIPTALVGAILGHFALKTSKERGYKNTAAFIAIIIGWIITGLVLAFVFLFIILPLVFGSGVGSMANF